MHYDTKLQMFLAYKYNLNLKYYYQLKFQVLNIWYVKAQKKMFS